MWIYIYIYVYLTNGSEYTTVIDIYIGRKLATEPSAQHSQMESPASLYKFYLSIPRPPPRLPYRDPVTSGGGNRRIPHIHNDITNIRIPFYALLHSGQKWTLCDMCWITHDVHVVWHTIASPSSTRRSGVLNTPGYHALAPRPTNEYHAYTNSVSSQYVKTMKQWYQTIWHIRYTSLPRPGTKSTICIVFMKIYKNIQYTTGPG